MQLLNFAFAPSQFESQLISALTSNARLIHHWVLESGSSLTAYVCYSQAYRAGRPIGFHLAPVAVHPKYQNRGLGSWIIRETLLQPPIAGRPVFVLGQPSYYTKFGFRRIRQPICPFQPSNEHFMALRYDGQEPFQICYEADFWRSEPPAAPNDGPAASGDNLRGGEEAPSVS